MPADKYAELEQRLRHVNEELAYIRSLETRDPDREWRARSDRSDELARTLRCVLEQLERAVCETVPLPKRIDAVQTALDAARGSFQPWGNMAFALTMGTRVVIDDNYDTEYVVVGVDHTGPQEMSVLCIRHEPLAPAVEPKPVCPDCQHDVSRHGRAGCCVPHPTADKPCPCTRGFESEVPLPEPATAPHHCAGCGHHVGEHIEGAGCMVEPERGELSCPCLATGFDDDNNPTTWYVAEPTADAVSDTCTECDHPTSRHSCFGCMHENAPDEELKFCPCLATVFHPNGNPSRHTRDTSPGTDTTP